MAQRPPLTPVRRPRGPSRRQVLLRRAVALVAALAALVALVGAVYVAFPHVRSSPPPAPAVAPPPPKPFRVIFPEGFTRAQMTARVAAVAKIAQRKKGKPVSLRAGQYALATRRATIRCFDRKPHANLEGFLFPATYDFVATTTARELAQEQLQTFCKNWTRLNLGYARTKQLTPYDVLIIASMIEKETLAPYERPLVSAVIYNRLRERIPLGIDATLRYGLHIPPTKSILQSQLDSDNPYNSRKLMGLPPTPIANPGLASLQAAAHPARVNYLYFVRKPDKVHHFFTASAAEFNRYACAHGYGCG